MRRFAAAAVLIGTLATASTAEALTTRDVIELARAGLGEDVLLALIEVDRGVYAIDPASLKALKDAGASDRVISALVRSGRERPPMPEPPMVAAEPAEARAPEPQVVVIDREPEVREVVVGVPVYVTGVPVRGAHGYRGAVRSTPSEPFIPFQSGPPPARPKVEQPKEPVYWGFGGKLRPDAWKPDGYRPDRKPDDKPEGQGRKATAGRGEKK